MSWRENYGKVVLHLALDALKDPSMDPDDRTWRRLETVMESYVENMRAEQHPDRHWVCVADVRGRCTKSSPVDSDAHQSCGEFLLTPAATIRDEVPIWGR